jgi:hypothetical protein
VTTAKRADITATFALLVLVQTVHSAEEYFGRLWETLLPPEIVSRVFSSDPQRGFLIANVTIVVFGVWCVTWPVRRGWAVAPVLLWGWVIVEVANGILHPLAAFLFGRYIAGVFTAPLLLVVALRLARMLRRRSA